MKLNLIWMVNVITFSYNLFLYIPADIFSAEYSEQVLGWLVGFYGISTFIDYLMPNLFLCK